MKKISMLSRKLRVAIAVISLIMMSLALPSCVKSREAETVILGIIQAEQATPVYVAESRQLFESNKLRVLVKNYDTGIGTINALLSGEVDIAMAAEFPFVKAVIEKQSVQIFAIIDRFENDYLIVRKDRGINTAADLKGKRVGVIKGTILEFYLGRFLELNGISLNDLAIVDTANTSQTTDSIVKGELDAVVAFQPYVNAIQLKLGEGVVTWPVQGNQLVYGVLASRSDWLKSSSDTVRRFIKTLSEANDYMASHQDTAKEILREKMNLDSRYISSIWSQHQFSLSLDFSLITAMTDEARWIIRNNLTNETNLPDFSKFIYADGLKTVKPEVVNINP